MTAFDLTLPEEILALTLTDRDGSLLDTTQYQFALGGAVLAELLLAGRIELESGSSDPLVTVVLQQPTGDPVLDDALKLLLEAPRRTSPQRWIDRLAELEETRMAVARQLCKKEVLDEHRGRVRLVFRRTVYADLDPKAKEEVTERVREGAFEDGAGDGRGALVAALAGAGNLLDPVFDMDEPRTDPDRVRQLLSEGGLDQATSEALALLVSATREAVAEAAAAA